MSNTSRTFARGELRLLSAAMIEANRDKTISEVAALHVRDFGFHEFKVAVIHIRWMLREGLVNDSAILADRWSRKNEKVTLIVVPTETEEAAKPAKPKRVRPSRAKKAKTEVAAATEESTEALNADVEAITEVMEAEAA